LEDYDLAYVSTGRDLAREKLKQEKVPTQVAFFGAPDFGGTPSDPSQDMLTRAGNMSSSRVTVRAFGGQLFEPLPGTRQEVKSIGLLTTSKGMPSKIYLGAEATEEQLKAIQRPKLLHVASHGFFLPESGWDQHAPGTSTTPQQELQDQYLAKWLKNPMHRSGLALAGVNITLEGKRGAGVEKEEARKNTQQPNMAGNSRQANKAGNRSGIASEDGILTAEEVAELDLAGTEAVVLSACETGLGEAKNGEGVLGLRRAFVQAGAENLVMALWSVSDEATQKLMNSMYGKYLDGQPVWKALLEAQREALYSERKAGREPNPYFWAGFVASGIGTQ